MMDEHGKEHQKFLDEFLDICKNHLKNDQQILTLVRQTYEKTNSDFLATCEFRDKVQRTGAKIESQPGRLYIFIKELIEELKPYKIKKDKKRKHEQENNSEHIAKKSRTLLLTATVELNAHEKFSNRYRDHSADEESPESGEGGSVVTTVADVHPLNLAKPISRLSNAVESLVSPVINSKRVNHSSPSNCSIHVNDNIENLDSILEQPGSRLRMRRINLQPVMDNGEDSESTQPPKTSLASPDAAEKDKAWNPVENGCESGASSISVTKKCKKTNKTDDAFLENGCSSTNQDVSVSESDSPVKKIRGRASERQIQRLEKLLYNMDKEIKRLGEKEIGIDDLDDDDSAYLRCERLKARFNKVFNKLCELKDREKMTGRVIEKRFGFEGTRYPEINKGIRKFVNKKKVFPDYQDVHAIIIRANRRQKLQLKKSAIDSLCREAFTDVGNQLQQRRHKDFISDFGCHLTDNDRTIADPAIFDKSLRRKLEENGKRGKSKMEEVLEKYARKQSDPQSGKLDDDTDDDDSDEVEEIFAEEERLEEKEQEKELDEVLNASDSEDELPVFGPKKPEPVMMIISDDESEPEGSPDIQSIYTSASEMESDSMELGGSDQGYSAVSNPRISVARVDHQGSGKSVDLLDHENDENSVESSDLWVVGVVQSSVETWKFGNSVNAIETENLDNVMETENREDTMVKSTVGDSKGISGLQVVGVVGNVQGMWGSQDLEELSDSPKSVDGNDAQKSVDRNGSQIKTSGELDVQDIGPNMLQVDRAKTPRERMGMGKVEKRDCSVKMKDVLSSSKRVKTNVNDTVGDSKASLSTNNLGESQVEETRRTSLEIRSPGQKKITNLIKSLKHGASGITDSPVAKISEPFHKRDIGTCCLKGQEESPALLKVADGVATLNGGVENDPGINKAEVEVCTISDDESELDLGWDFNHGSDADESLVELSDGDSESDKDMNLVEDAKTVASLDMNKLIKSSPTSANENIPSIDQFDIISTPVKTKPLSFDSAKLKLKCSPGFVTRTRNLIERTNYCYVSLTDSEDEVDSIKSGEGGEKSSENPPASEYIYIE
ncbi:uncharacterized protein LOC135501433 isoform X2 [Lineus longissimus]|uniref:uncharacterized protein LOC135501433 isoform X2 n=1 Tax=Lineus longissimus TaxID=88925 RepID=UPI002B4C5ECB